MQAQERGIGLISRSLRPPQHDAQLPALAHIQLDPACHTTFGRGARVGCIPSLEYLASTQFNSASLQSRLANAYSLVEPFAAAEQINTTYSALDNAAQFDAAYNTLRSFIPTRHTTVCTQLGIGTASCPP